MSTSNPHREYTREIQQMPQNIGQLLTTCVNIAPARGIRYCSATGESRLQDYRQLLDASLRLLGAMRAVGARPGHVVVILADRGEEIIPTFWACILGGFIACPMAPIANDPERWSAHLNHVQRLLDGPLVLTGRGLREHLPPISGLAIHDIEELNLTAAPHAVGDVTSRRSNPFDVAVLMLTSGSTGNAKAVELTHANILASLAAKIESLEITADDTTLTWVSFDHVGALLETHMLAVATGARQVQADPADVLASPLRLLQFISDYRVSLTFAPNFLLGLINRELDLLTEAPTLDLCQLRHLFSGGEANSVTTAIEFLDRLGVHGLRRNALRPGFGMTETCAGSIYNTEFPQADLGMEFAAVGRPLPGLEIRIAQEASDGSGELQLRGPMITNGYRNNAEATDAAFTPDGWFRSGDLGRIDDGRLTLVGRNKDCVIVNGVNYFSHELETALDGTEGIAPSFIAAFATRPPDGDTEQLVVAFAPLPEVATDESLLYRTLVAVRNGVVMLWGFRPALVLPLPRDAFPKTSLGKIQRSLMRRRLESGAYADRQKATDELVLRQLGGHVSPDGSTENLLTEVYAKVFDTSPEAISATAGFFDLGGTSLDILRLKRLLSQRIPGSDPSPSTLLAAPSVRALAARLDLAQAGASAVYDPIVPLQTSGSKTPLFCIHAAGGEALVFVSLAKYFLHERPVYAIRAKGFEPHEEPFDNWVELAGTYVDAIRRTQPHGPYAIAGYSLGAAAAFEVAKLLEAAGERVDFLGSIDLGPRIIGAEQFDFSDTAVNLAMSLDLITTQSAEGLAEQLRPLDRQQQIEQVLEMASPHRVVELDLNSHRLREWMKVAHSLTELANIYEPTGKVASVTAFHAAPLRGTRQQWLEGHIRCWDDFTRERNYYVEVPGEHFTMLGPSYVAAFQQILRAELNRALSGR